MSDPSLRLLFDENLAARLVAALAAVYPGSVHVRDIGLMGAPDCAIWDHAQLHDYIIVSKDEDFHRFSVLYGSPPKMIWIRLGNCSTEDIIKLLRERSGEIDTFLTDRAAAFLALG